MKYRKKPVVIEATQFFRDVKPWPQGLEEREISSGYGKYLAIGIPTFEGGFIEATDGDWIITGVKGERYPCKASIFEANYEAVDG